ncbi:MAG: DNA helicase RecQ [Planctomycetota bacterium]
MARSQFDDGIRSALRRTFGFDALRPLQREAIDLALDGRDSLVVMPTGGGKSLCYQLPPLVTGRLTVVVSPLIALMKDQVDGLRLLDYPAAALNSSVSHDDRDAIRTSLQAGEVKLLFVAPERLFADGFARWLAQHQVGSFAIDEAHCISQWGHDFRPEYRRLAELRELFPDVPFQAYTATATPRVREDVIAQLGLRDPGVLIGTFDRANLTYRVQPRTDRTRQVTEAIARHPGAAAIVYCISRKDTESLAEDLRAAGVDAQAYHAGIDTAVRSRISEDFRNERLAVVVATVAFGMGIDRSDVRLVVHAAMPKSLEHYQQETGRAGRDGLPSECLLLYSGADAAKWRSIMERSAEESGAAPETVEAQLELLSHMQRMANRVRCRHAAISEYFGQAYPHEDCGACDVCLGELRPVEDAHVIAQKILSAVARTGQRFGAAHVIDVLRGRRTAKVVERGHDRIPTFGLLADHPAQSIGNWIDQLIDGGDLARSDGEYPVLALTAGSQELLRSTREAVLVGSKVEPRARAARRSTARGERASRRDADPLAPAEIALFEELRALRRDIARELQVPPYLVFGDVSLTEMARDRPRTRDEMLRIKGVGQRKLDSFGDRFLQTIAAHVGRDGSAAEG